MRLAPLVLIGLWACDPPPPAPADAPAVPPLDLDVRGKQADLPWLQPGGSPAAPVAPADPRTIADEAFNVAMRAHETGDAATARLALPEALRAYAALPALDTDAGFHVAVLQLASGDPGQALASAEGVLATRPTHLLALGVGQRAALAAGDPARARAYAERLLAAYDAEQGQVAEYEHHAVALPIYRDEAQALVGG
ncbi:hypothetical protein L6R53_29630 [Myxococcota bacterium]|nr:hypothetical protein [Myxococcota bacterium]